MRIEYTALIIGMALAVAFTRFAALALFGSAGLPPLLARCLRHVPTAVFTAIIIPPVLMPSQQLHISLDNHYLLAGAATAALAWKYNNFILTTAAGTALIILLRLSAM